MTANYQHERYRPKGEGECPPCGYSYGNLRRIYAWKTKVRRKPRRYRTIRPMGAIGIEPSTSRLPASRAESLGHWWGFF